MKTDGNVAKTVALTTADEQLYSEVGILSDNRVVVCYALRNVDLIDCQIYKITLGTDVFIEKVGPTCKTFIYSSTRTIGMSVVVMISLRLLEFLYLGSLFMLKF